jgi:hypothetical protein
MTDEALALAIRGLMDSPHWVVFEQAIRERREQWITDTRSPTIYQSHAELAHVLARVAEVDWLLESFAALRTGNVQDT